LAAPGEGLKKDLFNKQTSGHLLIVGSSARPGTGRHLRNLPVNQPNKPQSKTERQAAVRMEPSKKTSVNMFHPDGCTISKKNRFLAPSASDH